MFGAIKNIAAPHPLKIPYKKEAWISRFVSTPSKTGGINKCVIFSNSDIHFNPTNMERKSLCVLGLLGLVACSQAASMFAPTPPAPTPDPSFECPSDEISFESDPYDCTSFYICSSGLAWKQTCDAGLYFNPIEELCDWPENVDCKALTRPPPALLNKNRPQDQICHNQVNYTCPADGAFEHELLCDFYYDCYNDVAFLCQCLGGMVFEPKWSGCEYLEQVDCGDRLPPGQGTAPTVVPPRTTTTKPTTTRGTGPTEANPGFQCPEDWGLFPAPEPCTPVFYQCMGGISFEQRCPDPLVFHAEVSNCDYKSATPGC